MLGAMPNAGQGDHCIGVAATRYGPPYVSNYSPLTTGVGSTNDEVPGQKTLTGDLRERMPRHSEHPMRARGGI